jgi:cell division protein FtsI (penicillin-binding protein 3)
VSAIAGAGRGGPARAEPIKVGPWRVRLLTLFLVALFGGLAVRALWLQGFQTGFLQQKGNSFSKKEIVVPAHRGRITDRNGEALAISTAVFQIFVTPRGMQPTAEQFTQLAGLLDMTGPVLKKTLADADGEFITLRPRVAPEKAEKISALRIPGLEVQRHYRRHYPDAEVTSQLLGFTNFEDDGQEGMELAQNGWLAGKQGMRRVVVDNKRNIIDEAGAGRLPQEGRDLALSIDRKLQHLAFRELRAAVEQNKAKAGGAVVLDVRTGEILALANLPAFDPNRRETVPRDKARNRALTDVFEPGSTLKPFTIAAALEAGVVRPDTVIQTAPGSMTIGAATIHDAHAYGALTVEQVIQKSSNVGAAKMALMLPSETMWQLFSRSGFGSPPRTGFPGEVSGRLRPYKTWRPIEQATMAYGHGISVNLIQLARAYTIFATDGELKPASLLKTAGEVAGQPVISAATARAVRHMMERAVEPGGTAPKAQVAGYRVAGKTGTAHKLEGRGYAPHRYVSSFVGMAPASNPRLIVAVMIDDPSGGEYYGGSVAAPVFSRITDAALRALNVPHDAPLDNVIMPAPDEPPVMEEV